MFFFFLSLGLTPLPFGCLIAEPLCPMRCFKRQNRMKENTQRIRTI